MPEKLWRSTTCWSITGTRPLKLDNPYGRDFFQGAAPKDVWKILAAPNALAGRFTILQAAEAQARGVLASHLGWLEKDAGRKINTIARRLNKLIMAKHAGNPVPQKPSATSLTASSTSCVPSTLHTLGIGPKTAKSPRRS